MILWNQKPKLWRDEVEESRREVEGGRYRFILFANFAVCEAPPAEARGYYAMVCQDDERLTEDNATKLLTLLSEQIAEAIEEQVRGGARV